jgi:hypothetical protein
MELDESFKPSAMLCCVDWYKLTDVLQGHNITSQTPA